MTFILPYLEWLELSHLQTALILYMQHEVNAHNNTHSAYIGHILRTYHDIYPNILVKWLELSHLETALILGMQDEVNFMC